MPFNENSLRKETIDYWRRLDRLKDKNIPEDQRFSEWKKEFEKYLADIFEKEIACATSHPERWPSEDQKAKVLVLLIGFSIEPLLFSLKAYQPEEVLLVLNRKYHKPNDGNKFANERVIPWLKTVGGKNLKIRPNPLKLPEGTNTGDFFKFLQENLAAEDNVVIDITGGKKNMVAGASLFAAYTGAKISYVDFEDYDEEFRRPYGYTCSVGFLPNPYEIYALRDWQRVRQHYEGFAFDQAAAELKAIAGSMSFEYFSPKQVRAVRIMRLVMQAFNLWMNGHYFRAHRWERFLKKLSNGRFKMIAAVEKLQSTWPRRTQLEKLAKAKFNELYFDIDSVLFYAGDEILKVEKIVQAQGDYRSGLLRAAGLNEVLFKARLAWLQQNGKLEVSPVPEEEHRASTQVVNNVTGNAHVLEEADIKVLIGENIAASGAEIILMAENGKPIKKSKLKYKEMKLVCTKSADANIFMGIFPTEERTTFLKQVSDLREVRNRATHAVIPVPQEIGELALAIAKANLADFKHWLQLPASDNSTKNDTEEGRERPPKWKTLCEWCGLDFLPQPIKE